MYPKLILTGILVMLFIGLSTLFSRIIATQERLETHRRRKILVRFRDFLSTVFVILGIAIWYPQLKSIATTLAVIAVAIAIGIKEYLLNLTGFLYRSTTRFFTIGDRIVVGDFRGDVIDHSLMGVSLIEIAQGTNQYTGGTVLIPNSLFLSTPVVNETRMMQEYVFHLIHFSLDATEDWQEAEQVLLDIGNRIIQPYRGTVEENLKELTRRHGLETPSVEPRIYIQLPEPGRIHLVLRLPVPILHRARMEQTVIREYLKAMQEVKAGSST